MIYTVAPICPWYHHAEYYIYVITQEIKFVFSSIDQLKQIHNKKNKYLKLHLKILH